MRTILKRTQSGFRRCCLGMILLLLAPPHQAAFAEEELGRLFFTPERRQTLDRQRQLNLQETQAFSEDPTLSIDGIVARSSGKRTVWINGVSQNENDPPSGVAVASSRKEPGKLTVRIKDAPSGKARVGDTINRNTGETADLLNGGEIRIHPQPPTRQ